MKPRTAPVQTGAVFFSLLFRGDEIMELSDVTIETTDFEEIAAEFQARVEQMVWCNVASVDEEGRPRSRVMHPIWERQVGSGPG